VIEGITFTLAKILSLASDSGVELNKLRVTGGGNRSAFWRQLQADVYQRPVSTTSSEDGGGAFGAALLAGVGAGVFHDVAAACERCVREVVTASPHGQLEPQLIASMQAFDEAYPRLRGLWHA
jgi:xylulokinase